MHPDIALLVSGRNKKNQSGQSYSYIMRTVWYPHIWIQNNLGFMVSDLMYIPSLSKDFSGSSTWQYCCVAKSFKFSDKMVNKRRLSLDALPALNNEKRKFKCTKTQIESCSPFKTFNSIQLSKNLLVVRGAIGGKTGKTAVLPWFCKKEHGGSGALQCYADHSLPGRVRRAGGAPGCVVHNRGA